MICDYQELVNMTFQNHQAKKTTDRTSIDVILPGVLIYLVSKQDDLTRGYVHIMLFW